ncbi:MAG: hypothetical protein KatS3mg109_0124 [Pirellulaceae bacterium]|nr:MAG: hypothetical protein KatS3mg109_0124 [Pirellulaceae bacterium]
MLTTVVTHPGRAHADEFLACAIIAAKEGRCQILRRNPTDGDLENPGVFVVDVGRQLDFAKRNLDHHQFPREAEPCCALSLVAEYYAIRDELYEVFPWFRKVEVLDSKGPRAAAQMLAEEAGIEQYDVQRLSDGLLRFVSPVEQAILDFFGECAEVEPDSLVMDLIRDIGSRILKSIEDFRKAMRRLADVSPATIGGVRVVDLRSVFRPDEPTFHETWLKKTHPDVEVLLLNSQRDQGQTTVLRRDSAVGRIDLSRIEACDGVSFAHKGGFIASVSRDADLEALLAASRVPAADDVS